MSFELRLLGKAELGKHPHCLELARAYAGIAPLWERCCLAGYSTLGPWIAGRLGLDAAGMLGRADRIIADLLAVTGASPAEIAAMLRRYVRLRLKRAAHLPFEEARASIYDQSFYPVVTHFTYAFQPSATARLNFVREAVGLICADGASVADLGCGSGVILSEVLMVKPSWRGYGLDISQAAVDYARRLAQHKGVAARACFNTGNLTRLPYADASLDMIVASEVIEHTPEPRAAIREIRRALKPGGRLVLTIPIASHTPGHAHTLGGSEDLQLLLEEAGLSVRRLESRWHFGYGDDRRHCFALAEAAALPPVERNSYSLNEAAHGLTAAYSAPEII